MSEDFRNRVAAHLDLAQKKIADVHKLAKEKRRAENDYLDRFDEMAKQIIHPVLMSARDELLGRNKPADVIMIRDRESEKLFSYIGLHCSDNIADIRIFRESPQFKLFYQADTQTTWRPIVATKQNDPTHCICRIEDVKIEGVEEAVLAFLHAYFPSS